MQSLEGSARKGLWCHEPRRGKKKSERWRTREVGLMKPKKTWRFIEVVYVFESDVIVVMSSERRLESC
jgi:hypothetical protein